MWKKKVNLSSTIRLWHTKKSKGEGISGEESRSWNFRNSCILTKPVLIEAFCFAPPCHHMQFRTIARLSGKFKSKSPHENSVAIHQAKHLQSGRQLLTSDGRKFEGQTKFTKKASPARMAFKEKNKTPIRRSPWSSLFCFMFMKMLSPKTTIKTIRMESLDP